MENQTEQTPYERYLERQPTREFIVLIADGDLDREFELMEQNGVMTDEKQG